MENCFVTRIKNIEKQQPDKNSENNKLRRITKYFNTD